MLLVISTATKTTILNLNATVPLKTDPDGSDNDAGGVKKVRDLFWFYNKCWGKTNRYLEESKKSKKRKSISEKI